MTIYLKNLYRRLNLEIYFFEFSLLLVKEEEIKKSPPGEIQQRTKLSIPNKKNLTMKRLGEKNGLEASHH